MENEIHEGNIKLLEFLSDDKFYNVPDNFTWKNVTKITLINYKFCIIEFDYEFYKLYKYELI